MFPMSISSSSFVSPRTLKPRILRTTQPTSHGTSGLSTTSFPSMRRTISAETLSADCVKLRSSDPNSTCVPEA